MTAISSTPVPARTDHTAERPTLGQPSTTMTRRVGLGLAAGTTAWAVTSMVMGFEPGTNAGVVATDLTGLLFQCGLMGLLHLQMRTRATGVSRTAGRMLRVERGLLSLAMLWSLLHALLPSQRDAAWLLALDAFWPLSMLGMFFIGIKVAVAGRWRGPARLWSLLAETWAPVCVPLSVVLGAGLGEMIAGTHLLLGYATLGLIVALRPRLVADRG